MIGQLLTGICLFCSRAHDVSGTIQTTRTILDDDEWKFQCTQIGENGTCLATRTPGYSPLPHPFRPAAGHRSVALLDARHALITGRGCSSHSSTTQKPQQQQQQYVVVAVAAVEAAVGSTEWYA